MRRYFSAKTVYLSAFICGFSCLGKMINQKKNDRYVGHFSV